MDNTTFKHWENLLEEKCPQCGNKLKFRVANRITKIRAHQYKDIKDDMYFCFRCDFQIRQSTLLKRIKKIQEEKPKTFTTGLLQF